MTTATLLLDGHLVLESEWSKYGVLSTKELTTQDVIQICFHLCEDKDHRVHLGRATTENSFDLDGEEFVYSFDETVDGILIEAA